MKNRKNKNKGLNTKEFDELTNAMAHGFLIDEKTKAIVKPYIRTMQVDEAAAFLKCLAGLLLVDDDERAQICNELLSDEAAFVLMMVRELDKIIKEHVK